jgi:hypothetical protein
MKLTGKLLLGSIYDRCISASGSLPWRDLRSAISIPWYFQFFSLRYRQINFDLSIDNEKGLYFRLNCDSIVDRFCPNILLAWLRSIMHTFIVFVECKDESAKCADEWKSFLGLLNFIEKYLHIFSIGTQTSPNLSPRGSSASVLGEKTESSQSTASVASYRRSSSSELNLSTDEGQGLSPSVEAEVSSDDYSSKITLTGESGIGTTSPRNRHRRGKWRSNRSKTDLQWEPKLSRRRTRSLDCPSVRRRKIDRSIESGSDDDSTSTESTRVCRRIRRTNKHRQRDSDATLVDEVGSIVTDVTDRPRSGSCSMSTTMSSDTCCVAVRPKLRKLILRKLAPDLVASSSSTSTLDTTSLDGRRRSSARSIMPIIDAEQLRHLERLRKWSHPVAKPHQVVKKLGKKCSSAPMLKTLISPTDQLPPAFPRHVSYFFILLSTTVLL